MKSLTRLIALKIKSSAHKTAYLLGFGLILMKADRHYASAVEFAKRFGVEFAVGED